MRFITAISWALLSLMNGFAFCVFGWTAANVPAPMNDPDFPLPGTLWTVCMGTIAVIMLIVCLYALLKALDKFLPEGDPRRLFG